MVKPMATLQAGPPEEPGNGHATSHDLIELDRLVAAEVAALRERSEPSLEVDVLRLARRIRDHPDRLALLDRLRLEVLGSSQGSEPARVPDPETGGGDT
jgi:hypothetical protein